MRVQSTRIPKSAEIITSHIRVVNMRNNLAVSHSRSHFADNKTLGSTFTSAHYFADFGVELRQETAAVSHPRLILPASADSDESVRCCGDISVF